MPLALLMIPFHYAYAAAAMPLPLMLMPPYAAFAIVMLIIYLPLDAAADGLMLFATRRLPPVMRHYMLPYHALHAYAADIAITLLFFSLPRRARHAVGQCLLTSAICFFAAAMLLCHAYAILMPLRQRCHTLAPLSMLLLLPPADGAATRLCFTLKRYV